MTSGTRILAHVFAALALLASVGAFYLPGINPNDFEEGAPLEILASKLYSTKDQLPYDYYSVPQCLPSEDVQRGNKVRPHQHLNLGQILSGSRQELTPYEIFMNIGESCKVLCTKNLDQQDVKRLKSKIADDYYVRLNLDNMPGVQTFTNSKGEELYFMGYPLGNVENSGKNQKIYFNNHVEFTVLIHQPKYTATSFYTAADDNAILYRVVGLEVRARSVKHKFQGQNLTSCPVEDGNHERLELADSQMSITFTYDISFVMSEISWATRWDPLLKASPEFKRVQYFSIVNSLLIVLFLTALVAMILLRTVYLDFARYNNLEDREDIQEDSGWKLCHADAFRPPPAMGLLAVLCGTGAQVTMIFISTVFFALLGFLSPANRGGLLTALISLWVLTSSIAGYVSARLYAGMGGESKNSVAIGSSFLFSGTAFCVFFFINAMAVIGGSSEAVPFLTLLFLLLIWFGVSVPLNWVGSIVGGRRKPFDFPTRTASIPREIPRYSPIPPTVFSLLTGILPFGVMFIELVFILNSIWTSEIYYMFGFLFAVFLLLAVTCVEVSIVIAYLLLCNEDYRWWWQSFIASGSSGAFMFGYCIIYLFTTPDFHGIHFSSALIFLGYMLVVSVAMICMTGGIGFNAAFLFVQKIFDSVHID